MEIKIREACAADAGEMIIYNKKVGAETDFLSFDANTFNISEEKEARFLERFKNAKRDLMLIALDDEKIIASASVEGNKVRRYSHRAELSITVLRDFWGKGIGSILMERVISFARENDYKSIYLDVRADNERAIALYEKFKFEKIGVYPDYFKIEDKCYDAQLMVLHL